MSGQPQKIGGVLKKWRTSNGWNQTFAAGKLGVKVGTYRNWERDRCAPQGLAHDTVLKAIQPCSLT